MTLFEDDAAFSKNDGFLSAFWRRLRNLKAASTPQSPDATPARQSYRVSSVDPLDLPAPMPVPVYLRLTAREAQARMRRDLAAWEARGFQVVYVHEFEARLVRFRLRGRDELGLLVSGGHDGAVTGCKLPARWN